MKRFIDLGDQTGNIIYEVGEREFAFYCTVTDKFETFNSNQTWSTRQDLKYDMLKDGAEATDLIRFFDLIPSKIK